MNVIWVGQGTGVPTDEFVVAVNKLYDAVHDASKKDYPGGRQNDRLHFRAV